MKAPHPGTITYVDLDTGKSETSDVMTVPEAMRFAETEHGRTAVVRVVAQIRGDQRTIREYDADGREVRATVQRRGRPSR